MLDMLTRGSRTLDYEQLIYQAEQASLKVEFIRAAIAAYHGDRHFAPSLKELWAWHTM
jgi:hypothetical protein